MSNIALNAPTAHAAGLTGCTVCGRAAPKTQQSCTRCGARLPKGGRQQLDAVWAWLVVGIIFYIPANLYPMLISQQFGQKTASTIVGGAFDLIDHGAYAIAAIVLVASVVIPVLKFAAIARLAIIARRTGPFDHHSALHLYEIVEFIGRWSMIDVFVVAILAALVRMGFLAELQPGPAAAFFALSVAATMLSARAFDPKLVWDRIDRTTARTAQEEKP